MPVPHTSATMDYLHAILADSLLSAMQHASQPCVKGHPAPPFHTPHPPRATVYIPVMSVTSVAAGCAHVLCVSCGQTKHPLFALKTPCCHHICYPCYTAMVKRLPSGSVITCPEAACAQSLPMYKWVYTNKDGVKYKSDIPFIANYDRDSRHLLHAGYPTTLQFRAPVTETRQDEVQEGDEEEQERDEEEQGGDEEEQGEDDTQDSTPEPPVPRRKRAIELSDDEEDDGKRCRRG